MKTEDLVQLGALGIIGYLAWQKFKPKEDPGKDFGLANPNDSSWGDNSTGTPTTGASPQNITLIDQLLTAYL